MLDQSIVGLCELLPMILQEHRIKVFNSLKELC